MRMYAEARVASYFKKEVASIGSQGGGVWLTRKVQRIVILAYLHVQGWSVRDREEVCDAES